MIISKGRLETFCDGVIAIIITIMVLSIPLPRTFAGKDLFEFFISLVIYFLSFLVVGGFWNQHHQVFHYISKIDQKIIVTNIFFLFFLSLIPLFTKWVIENQGDLIPVIGYDLIYFLVSFCYMIIFRSVIQQSDHEEVRVLTDTLKKRPKRRRSSSWMPLIMLLGIIATVVFISIYHPKLATIILMGIPILSSVFNLFNSGLQRKR